MAHKSKKKHLKHVHQHEPATPKAKSPVARAETARVARPVTKSAAKAKNVGPAKAAPAAEGKAQKKRGIMRSFASSATKKITARPRRIISRVKARVKAAIGGSD